MSGIPCNRSAFDPALNTRFFNSRGISSNLPKFSSYRSRRIRERKNFVFTSFLLRRENRERFLGTSGGTDSLFAAILFFSEQELGDRRERERERER